jgi:hypothetical protein
MPLRSARCRHRLAVAIAVMVVGTGLSGCEKEPPDLPAGHVTWLDRGGSTRLMMRAKPYGYRVVADGASRWARIDREPGAVRLDGRGRALVLAQRTPDGAQLTDGAGQLRAAVRVTPGGVSILDRAAAPLGRVVVAAGKVLIYNAGGLPLGTVEAGSGGLVQRSRDGAITGTVLGCNDPVAAAVLQIEDLPLEDRVALFALRLERQ